MLSKKELEKALQTKYIRQIAKENQVHTKSVYDWIDKYNLTIPTKTEKTAISLIGKKYNKLTVLGFGGLDKHKKLRLECLCDCGNKIIVNHSSLKRELTKSCGCYKQSVCRKNGYEDISYSYYKRLKQGAYSRNIEWSIDIKEIWNKYIEQDKKCIFSGLPINFYPDYNKQKLQTASVDRIDCMRSYSPDNIQICHKRINYMKGNMTDEEFLFWINHIYKTRKPHEVFIGEHRELLKVYRNEN